jgi:hypothetical protein
MKKKWMAVFLVLVAFNLFPVEFVPGIDRSLFGYVLELSANYGVPYRFIGYVNSTLNKSPRGNPSTSTDTDRALLRKASLYEAADVFIRGTVIRGLFPVTDDVIKKYVVELQAENFTLDWKDPFHSAYIAVRRFADLWEYYYGEPPVPYPVPDGRAFNPSWYISNPGVLGVLDTSVPSPFLSPSGSLDDRWLKVIEAYLGGTGPVDRGAVDPRVTEMAKRFLVGGGRGDPFYLSQNSKASSNEGVVAVYDLIILIKTSGFLPVK